MASLIHDVNASLWSCTSCYYSLVQCVNFFLVDLRAVMIKEVKESFTFFFFLGIMEAQ